MDDQLLEKRLESLKSAYDEMPEDENRSAILAAIKRDQQKKRRNKWIHLPYAASFIGVGMIAGVLMMQYIDGHDPSGEKTEQQQASTVENSSGDLQEADVKDVFEDLEKYYKERVAETKAELGLGAGFEKYLYPSIGEDIQNTKNEFLTYMEEHDKQDLAEMRKNFRSQIDQAFTLPSEIINKIQKEGHEEADFAGDEFTLLTQLDSYTGVYQYGMVFYEWNIKEAISKEGLETVVEKMNAGGNGLSDNDLKKMAAVAVENGYAFREEDGKLLPYVNFMGIADRLRGKVNEDYITYLELRSNRIQNNMGKVISYKNYADVLVKLETAIGTVEDLKINDILRTDVQSLYALFTLGSTVNPIYGEDNLLKEEVKDAYLYLFETYPETDTAAAVKVMYEQMKSDKFLKPANEMKRHENLVYPRYINSANNSKAEDMINKAVLPIPASLLSSYKEFAAKKDFNILKNYGPFEIMQLYFHADQAGDYETKYALYSKNDGKPSEEQYIQEQEMASLDLRDVLKGYEYAALYHAEDDSEEVVGVQLHFADRPDGPVFQMVQEDGFWKVRYLPFQ
ncbi:hypothetical protein [Bacillus sp. ISL-55]|uniref:hypothetical protein n=1 Tax=Bacillus sp. ISL-55 TaxID=2819134 RepID=UPI001BECDC0A|nr:hypothetical protein [Bacillus sp. ISL-55]MBT2694919.1 hypothetical protein [Bacillus sp. ISL-55]